MRRIALAVSAILLSGCNRIPDEALMALLTKKTDRAPIIRCLQIEQMDPTPELITALNINGARYSPFSACKPIKFGYVAPNGKPALIVFVSNFKRTSPWRATVEYSESTGFLGGSGWTITLERKDGKWVVVSEIMEWISVGPNNSFKPTAGVMLGSSNRFRPAAA